MAFKILLQNNHSAKNRIGKDINTIREISGDLRDESSIINPKILIRLDDVGDLKNCNYMSIPEFGRKYFVTDITSVRHNMVEVSGHVDVLETYATEIDKNTAIIARQSSTSFGNTYLDDGLLATYQDTYVVSYNFPQKFSKTGHLILCVAGASQ